VAKEISDEIDFSVLLSLFPEPLVHAKSVPNLLSSHSEMRSSRGGDGHKSGAVSKPSPLGVHHDKSLSETSSRRRSRSDLVALNQSDDNEFAACLSPAGGENSSTSTITQKAASKTVQSSSLTLERQARNKKAEHRVRRRSEVSTICLHVVVCLFAKHAVMHNETVSQHPFLFFTTTIRQVMQQIKISFAEIAWHFFPLAHTSLCNGATCRGWSTGRPIPCHPHNLESKKCARLQDLDGDFQFPLLLRFNHATGLHVLIVYSLVLPPHLLQRQLVTSS
jgi:hypothetical protein